MTKMIAIATNPKICSASPLLGTRISEQLERVGVAGADWRPAKEYEAPERAELVGRARVAMTHASGLNSANADE